MARTYPSLFQKRETETETEIETEREREIETERKREREGEKEIYITAFINLRTAFLIEHLWWLLQKISLICTYLSFC